MDSLLKRLDYFFVSSKNRQIAIYLVALFFCLILVILFDTEQQKYYVDRYSLWPGGNPIPFHHIAKVHFISWLIWFIAGVPLIALMYRDYKRPPQFLSLRLLKYFLLVATAIIVTSFCMAIEYYLTDDYEQSREVFIDNFSFFLHQKTPVFFIAYVGLLALVQKFNEREQLIIRIQELKELNSTNTLLYNELKKSHSDTDQIISVKIGNRMKQVVVSDVIWVESDNYCVKLHTKNNNFTIRASMKYLEKFLPSEQFIRVHRQAIVNMVSIEELSGGDTPILKLKNGVEIKVANSRISDVRKRIRSKVA